MSEPQTLVKSDEVKTVEVTDEAPVSAPVAPTRDELKAKGWTAKDLDAAEKRGMLEAKKADEKPAEKLAAVKDGEKPAVKEDEKPAVKPKGVLPDFTMTPDQERVFAETFGAGTAPRAMYFRMKNERQSRQAAESRIRELEAQIKAGETVKPQRMVETDENGNEIDPADKPLTLKALKELQVAEQEAYQKREQEQAAKAHTVKAAQTEQEEYARSMYPDFDKTVELAKDVMVNLDALVPEKWKQTKIVKLVRELQVAAAQADQIGIDEYHAAQIAYELGQLHPKYGQALEESEETGLSKDPKGNGTLKAEQMKRIEANTQRRVSSASVVDGGGKRTMSVEDIDLATLNKMDLAKRTAFKKNHPERYAKLLRG